MRLRPAICLALIGGALSAADLDGQFAIKGGGLQTCAKFRAAVDQKTDDVAIYGGWVEGYMTGQNQRLDQTYDIAPWQTTSTLLQTTYAICGQMADDTLFINALDQVMRLSLPSRLPQSSPVITLRDDTGMGLVMYRDMLPVIAAALGAAGHPVDSDPGTAAFADDFAAALRGFQTDRGLTPSGRPTQRTLLALFLNAG